MRFLNKALNGRSPMLIDPTIAKQYAIDAEKFGFTDLLTQVFGEVAKPYKVGSYGVIPIVGVIGKGLSPLERMTGASDLNIVSDQIDAFLADSEVQTLVFHIDSPGGVVGGVEEVARKIANSSKPTIAYTDGMMCSAAYWLGSSADRVISSPSADIGSIGVYMNLIDVSQAYADMGVKAVVIKSSATPYKAAGIEGTSLSQEQINYFQSEVDAIYADFTSSVKAKRKMASEDAMKGQSMSGKIASSMGLLTGLADSLSEVLNASTLKSNGGMTAKKVLATGIKKKTSDVEDTVLELLTPRQKEMVDSYCDVEETFGMFKQDSSPDGAHYSAVSPFADTGLLCQNCVFYRGPRGCGLVDGDIDPNGICKLWVIPGSLIKE
jgi:signal peptide peptidase SppA